jgi:hypothetical protein
MSLDIFLPSQISKFFVHVSDIVHDLTGIQSKKMLSFKIAALR